jgi:hypothetical protein
MKMKLTVSLLALLFVVSSVLAKDTLYPDEKLEKGSELTSRNGTYRLTLQDDGNLVLYKGSNALWSSGTSGKAVKHAIMQNDGNFVVYGYDDKAVWSSGTNKNPNSVITLQSDGNLVIYRNKPVWSTDTKESKGAKIVLTDESEMHAGQELAKGSSLESENGAYKLTMQEDGNLVVYNTGGKALWSSKTNGKAVKQCILQDDGNLVLYGFNDKPIWASGTNGNKNAVLRMQNDGNLVIYGSSSVWSSGTAGK